MLSKWTTNTMIVIYCEMYYNKSMLLIDKIYFVVSNLLLLINHMYCMPSKTSETKLIFVYLGNEKITTT